MIWNMFLVHDSFIFFKWGLICDLEYVPTWIKTAQMVGVLVGAVINGQLGITSITTVDSLQLEL